MSKPIETRDTNGNLTYRKESDGVESWYDANGNLTYFKDSDGYEVWKQYDTNGNLTYRKDSNGYEEWRQYDTNGNLTYRKDCNGYERWYDANGNVIDAPKPEANFAYLNQEILVEFVKENKEEFANFIINKLSPNQQTNA